MTDQKVTLMRKILRLTTAAVTGLLPAVLLGRPIGIDVSAYQGSINWPSVKNAGITCAWAQATEGTAIVDPTFTTNMNGAKAAGIPIGPYHLCYPGLSGNTPATEAAYFWKVAGSYIKADGLTLMPMLDMEKWGGQPQGADSWADWANQWCQNVVDYAAAAEVTIKPVIYINVRDSRQHLNSSVRQWHSSIACYNGQNPQTGTPWPAGTEGQWWGLGSWDSWQYTSSGSVSGISGRVDMDVFNGTSITPLIIHRHGKETKNCIDYLPDGAMQIFMRALTGKGSRKETDSFLEKPGQVFGGSLGYSP